MATHTHRGHCQLCDHLQAVNPKTGLLAKHGYHKQWGFFSGTCPGSDHLPYQVATYLIPGQVVAVKATVGRLEERIVTLARLHAQDPTAAVMAIRHRRVGHREEIKAPGHFGVGSREVSAGGFTQVRSRFVLDTPVTFADGYTVREIPADELYRRGLFYGPDTTPETYGAVMHTRDLVEVRDTIKRHTQYQTWLEARLAKWTLYPLVPVRSRG